MFVYFCVSCIHFCVSCSRARITFPQLLQASRVNEEIGSVVAQFWEARETTKKILIMLHHEAALESVCEWKPNVLAREKKCIQICKVIYFHSETKETTDHTRLSVHDEISYYPWVSSMKYVTAPQQNKEHWKMSVACLQPKRLCLRRQYSLHCIILIPLLLLCYSSPKPLLLSLFVLSTRITYSW